MGGDYWHSTGPYEPDIAAAFRSARETALADGNLSDFVAGRTIEELWEDPEWQEYIFTGGTGSLLDYWGFEGPSAQDGAGVMRLISADEIRAWCPSGRPTLADWIEANGSFRLPYPDRAEGHCTVLYQDGQPAEIAYWGVTAD
jgi:hypothetical protein